MSLRDNIGNKLRELRTDLTDKLYYNLQQGVLHPIKPIIGGAVLVGAIIGYAYFNDEISEYIGMPKTDNTTESVEVQEIVKPKIKTSLSPEEQKKVDEFYNLERIVTRPIPINVALLSDTALYYLPLVIKHDSLKNDSDLIRLLQKDDSNSVEIREENNSSDNMENWLRYGSAILGAIGLGYLVTKLIKRRGGHTSTSGRITEIFDEDDDKEYKVEILSKL